MPYEVQQEQLLALFHQLNQRTPAATYLLPWMSDYALLRFSSPGSRIELCLSVLPGSRLARADYVGELAPADRWWAGADHYVGSREQLLKLPHPWMYIGWTYNPAFTELLHQLSILGAVPQRAGRLHNHLTGSWIWGDQSLSLRRANRSGLYLVYDVRPSVRGLGLRPAGGH